MQWNGVRPNPDRPAPLRSLMEALQTNAEPDGRAIALQQEREALERQRRLGIAGYDRPTFTDQFTAPINDEIAWLTGYGTQALGNVGRNITGQPVEVSALDRARAMRQISNEGQDQFVEDYPVQAFTGAVLGGAAMAPARGAAIPGVIGRLGTEAGLGAAYGAAEGDSLADRLSGAGFGAGVGLALGSAAELAAPHIGRLVNRFRGRGGSQAVENAGYRVESSQDLAPTDTPESLRAQGYEIDPATNTWARTVATEAPLVDYPIRAFHGSPHSFDRFSLDKIGTGEGAQAYGHGLYFAESEDVARSYRDALQQPALSLGGNVVADNPRLARLAQAYPSADSAIQGVRTQLARAENALAASTDDLDRMIAEADISEARATLADLEPYAGQWFDKTPTGSMYEVGINADPNTFLDWDRPLSEQPEVLQRLGFANMDEDAIHAEAARIFEAQPGGAWMEDPVSKARIDELNTMLERRPPSGTGQDFYRGGANNDVSGILSQMGYGDPAGQSQYLREAGIPGIRYLDAGSRGAAEVNDLRGTRSMWETALRRSPDDAYARSMFEEADAALRQAEAGLSSNYVVFNDELVKILRKYGISGLSTTVGASALAEELDRRGQTQEF